MKKVNFRVMKFNGRGIFYLVCIIFFGLIVSCQMGDNESETYDGIELEAGMKAILIAKEPLISSPVAFAFDEKGYLFVIEDRGYPDSVGGKPTHEGSIVRLEDTDGDGIYDEKTVFATHFSYPNGILPWKGGIFVTCAPDIIYLKDTTGDGVTDIRKTVLTGFNATKTSQLRMSHPILGLDGWIYIAGGLNGGKVISPEYPERDTVKFTSSDGRFNPDTYEFELTGGNSQFGLTFDNFGRRFGNSNRHPLQHTVMEPKYINRNPYLIHSNTVQNVAKFGDEGIVFPISDAVTTSDYMPGLIGQSHQGTYTSACSPLIFDGDGMKPEHKGNVFICEPAQNLVQRQILVPEGGTFSSKLAYKDHDFLASTDIFFRPVFLGHGPGGGLYVVDMHRGEIDEPEYMPEEVRDKLDYTAGKDMGRIYEIVRDDYKRSKNNKKFLTSPTSPADILKMLDSDNGWNRRTAFRLLLEKRDKMLIPSLQDIALNAEYTESRVLALWLLHALQGINRDILMKTLKNKNPGVREQGIWLAMDFSKNDGVLRKTLISLSTDPNKRVRFVDALVIGSFLDKESTKALANIALQDGTDAWTRKAVFSGIGQRMGDFLSALQKLGNNSNKSYSLVMKGMGNMIGRGASIATCKDFVSTIFNDEKNGSWHIPAALGLAKGVSGRDQKQSKLIFNDLLGNVSNNQAKRFINEVIKAAQETSLPEDQRTNAIELLGFLNDSRVYPILSQALTDNSQTIQSSAIKAVSSLGTVKAANLLTEKDIWSGLDPQIRASIITELTSNKRFILVLLDGIKDKIIAPTDISSNIRERLMRSPNKKIQKESKNVFSNLEQGDRMEAYNKYKDLMKDKKGNANAGEAVFKQTCARCHSYAGKGADVGPDLTDVKNQPAEAILLHILVPNYEVYPQYQTINIETKEGDYISGWVTSKTAHSITLKTAGGTNKTVSKSNIKTMENTGKSLMPNGLEKTMTKEELRDLIAYIKSGSSF